MSVPSKTTAVFSAGTDSPATRIPEFLNSPLQSAVYPPYNIAGIQITMSPGTISRESA
jgi:hypothetical protein